MESDSDHGVSTLTDSLANNVVVNVVDCTQLGAKLLIKLFLARIVLLDMIS